MLGVVGLDAANHPPVRPAPATEKRAVFGLVVVEVQPAERGAADCGDPDGVRGRSFPARLTQAS